MRRENIGVGKTFNKLGRKADALRRRNCDPRGGRSSISAPAGISPLLLRLRRIAAVARKKGGRRVGELLGPHGGGPVIRTPRGTWRQVSSC